MEEDADWGKMQPTWGNTSDVNQLNQLFDRIANFCSRNDLPAFIGEYGVVASKERASRQRWLSSVTKAAVSRKMVPVLWETGQEISRQPPFTPSPELRHVPEEL